MTVAGHPARREQAASVRPLPTGGHGRQEDRLAEISHHFCQENGRKRILLTEMPFRQPPAKTRNALISRDFGKVSDGTRTHDRLDHNRIPGVFPTRRQWYLQGFLVLSCCRFRSN